MVKHKDQTMSPVVPTRLFLLGAGFSKPAGLPLATELLPHVRAVAKRFFQADGYSHLEHALEMYDDYVADVDPGRPFDLEQFGAWLDWEHVLRMKGSDTFSEHGNQSGLQLRWAIGKVLHETTKEEIPELYLDFARNLRVSDRVLTLNYDLVLERALEAVGLPYRRFPGKFSEIQEMGAILDPDQPDELVIHKLHGSIDWTMWSGRQDDVDFRLEHLVEGPRHADDPLLHIAVIPPDQLSDYYSSERSWWANPTLLLPPSTAKPLAGSALIPLWDGVGLYAYMLGGFTVIGCSLAAGDPYVKQLAYHIATDYVMGRLKGGVPWSQRRMKVVNLHRDDPDRKKFLDRFRFFNRDHTDFIFDGFSSETLDEIFDNQT